MDWKVSDSSPLGSGSLMLLGPAVESHRSRLVPAIIDGSGKNTKACFEDDL